MDIYPDSIRTLPLVDRIKIVQTIWDDIVADGEQLPLPQSAIEEAKRRRDEMLADPAIGLTQDDVWKRIKDARG